MYIFQPYAIGEGFALGTLFKRFRFPLIFLFFLLFSSCNKDKIEINPNYNPIIIGHGGMGISHPYPLNSLESFLLALNSGAHGIEIDVQLTKDLELIAFHDKDLNQSTNGKGSVYQNEWETISKLQYNFPIYANYPIISLSQLFMAIPNVPAYSFIFDCKNYNPDNDPQFIEQFCLKLDSFIQFYNLSENVIVECNNTLFLEQFKKLNNNVRLMFYGDFKTALEVAIQYDLYAIDCNIEELSAKQVQEAREHQLIVSVYNSKNKALNRKSIEIKADIIQTDALSHITKLLQ